MNIALDYDKTFTADPVLWREFCTMARKRGHKIYMVTMRFNEETVDEFAASSVDEIVYTAREAKKKFTEIIGLDIDIWIDDSPFWIYQRGAA